MSKIPCLYCGANPVNHRLVWTTETMMTMSAPFNRRLYRTRLGWLVNWISDGIEQVFLHILILTGAARFTKDRTDHKIGRAKVLWDEAETRGIVMEALQVGSKFTDMYRAQVNRRRITFRGLPRLTNGLTDAEWWLDDKGILKEKLLAARIPVAAGGSFSSFAPLLERFRALEKPVIIKPRLGSRGRHTTTHIYTEEQLRQAFAIAKQLCHWVLMEEHLVGPVYRGTIIDGKLAGVLAGYPPRISGDGKQTIRQLIIQKNANKIRPKIKDVVMTPLMELFLARSNRTLDDVLPDGQEIDLSEKVGISYGGSSEEVTDITHPDIKKILEAAAAVVNDPMIGFDFIIADIAGDPAQQKWGIIECNGTPFIDLHHDPILGKPQNVAAHVWDFVERRLSATR